MSFDELPKIDQYSENEDESNTHFLLHFSQKNGFLPTKPSADKGCDYIVELIQDRQSTCWRFPVQIKSIKSIETIDNGRYISYSFKASRLRYLLEAIPPVGLIILFQPDNKRLYYDYVENIYARVLEEREGSIVWKDQEMVRIHIPTLNIINDPSCKQIHEFILKRHQNSTDRSPNLYPAMRKIENDIAQESENPTPLEKEPTEILRNEGLHLYYDHQIPKLNQLIDKVPINLLREDAHLSLLAGIMYDEMGLPVDASYFLEKALNNHQINNDDHQHAEWAKLHVDSRLGKISFEEYDKRVSFLLKQLPPEENLRKLHYELSLARNDLDRFGSGDIRSLFEYAEKFYSFNKRIYLANLDAEMTVRYYMLNATNMGLLLLKTDWFFRNRIVNGKKNNAALDSDLIAEIDKLLNNLKIEVEQTFARIKPLARNFVHKVMLARCQESHLSIRLLVMLNELKCPINKLDFASEEHRNWLIQNEFGNEAFGIFLEHNHYYSAYNVGLMLMELIEIASHSNVTLDIDTEQLKSKVNWLQQKIGIDFSNIQSKELIKKYKAISQD